MLNFDKILFNVENNGEVSLCFGPISVKVCDSPEDFEDFITNLVRQLNTISDELKEYY